MASIKNGKRPVSEESNQSPALWYAYNHRMKTKAAIEQAITMVDQVRQAQFSDGIRLEENELFIALHTCAFRASHPETGKRDATEQHRKWVERWEILREYIVEQNLGLVYSMIGRLGSRKVDEDDMQSEAMFALSRAVDRYNPWRGYRFSTYACNVIARALMRRGKQQSHYRRLFPVQHEMTFEKPQAMPDLDSDVYVERLQRIMGDNLGQLTELESTILSRRFPARDEVALTFKEIGDEVGLSKERVRQIQNIALTKLRTVLELDPLLQ